MRAYENLRLGSSDRPQEHGYTSLLGLDESFRQKCTAGEPINTLSGIPKIHFIAPHLSNAT